MTALDEKTDALGIELPDIIASAHVMPAKYRQGGIFESRHGVIGGWEFLNSGVRMKVLFVIPAEAGIQAAVFGLAATGLRAPECCSTLFMISLRPRRRATQLTFIFRGDLLVMTVRLNHDFSFASTRIFKLHGNKAPSRQQNA